MAEHLQYDVTEPAYWSDVPTDYLLPGDRAAKSVTKSWRAVVGRAFEYVAAHEDNYQELTRTNAVTSRMEPITPTLGAIPITLLPPGSALWIDTRVVISQDDEIPFVGSPLPEVVQSSRIIMARRFNDCYGWGSVGSDCYDAHTADKTRIKGGPVAINQTAYLGMALGRTAQGKFAYYNYQLRRVMIPRTKYFNWENRRAELPNDAERLVQNPLPKSTWPSSTDKPIDMSRFPDDTPLSAQAIADQLCAGGLHAVVVRQRRKV